jgi:hypothetical protein
LDQAVFGFRTYYRCAVDPTFDCPFDLPPSGSGIVSEAPDDPQAMLGRDNRLRSPEQLRRAQLQVGRQLVEINAGNWTAVLPYLAGDDEYHDPIVDIDGPDTMAEFLGRLFAGSSDFYTTVEHETLVDGVYMATWTMAVSSTAYPSVPRACRSSSPSTARCSRTTHATTTPKATSWPAFPSSPTPSWGSGSTTAAPWTRPSPVRSRSRHCLTATVNAGAPPSASPHLRSPPSAVPTGRRLQPVGFPGVRLAGVAIDVNAFLLALEDFVPVVLSAIGLWALLRTARVLGARAAGLVAAGFVLITIGGITKPVFKTLVAVVGWEAGWLDDALFWFLAPGFLVLFAGLRRAARIDGGRPASGERWAEPSAALVVAVALLLGAAGLGAWFAVLLAVSTVGNVLTAVTLIAWARARGDGAAAVLFAGNLVVVLGLAGAAAALEPTVPVQWAEQTLATAAQAMFMVASIRLRRAVVRGPSPALVKGAGS